MSTLPQQAPKPRLSVAMIVRDEQDVLAATIQSVHSIADEIVVHDTGSTDRTPLLAEQLGASVTRMPWPEDFSVARNRVLDQVTGDWILWLDAGERLVGDSAGEIRKFVDHQADPRKVYTLMIEVPPADPSASSEQAARSRLLPRHPHLRFQGRVRETLLPAMEAIGLEVDAAPGRILRHPRQHDPRLKALRARRDLQLIAREIPAEQLPPPRLALAKGEAYGNLDDQQAARQSFLQAVEASEHGSTDMLEAYYGLLPTFDGDQAQQDRQVTTCLEALEIFPLDAQLLCAMGNYLQNRNQLELAARAFQTALAYGQINLQTWHLCEIAEVTAVCLNLILQLQGKDDEARRVLEETLEHSKHPARLRRHLIDLHVKHDRPDEAIRLIDQVPIDSRCRQASHNAVRGACHAARQDWLTALGYLQSAYVAGYRDPLCLRWLSVTLVANAQTAAAEPVLREWLGLEPSNLEAQKYLAAIKQAAQPESAAAPEPPSQATPARRLRIDSPAEPSNTGPIGPSAVDHTASADSATD